MFSLVAVVGGLVVADLAAGLSGVLERRRITIETTEGTGTCFSSDDHGELPIDVAGSGADRAMLGRILLPAYDLSTLVREAPHCNLVRVPRRERGFFPHRRRHVVLVGDSFTAGTGVPDRGTLGYLLGRRYAAYNWMNFGCPGHNVLDVLAGLRPVLRGKARSGTPMPAGLEAVVYFYNLNDALAVPGVKPNNHIWPHLDGEPLPAAPGPVARMLALAAPASTFARVLTRALEAGRTTDQIVRGYRNTYFSPHNREPLRRTFETLRAMARAVRERSSALTLVIYPLLFRDRDGRYPFEKIHSKIMDFCREHGLRCVDGAPAFRGVADVSRLHVHATDHHPNGRANRVMADYLAENDRLGLNAGP